MSFGVPQNVSDEYMHVFIPKLIALFVYMRPQVKGVALRSSRHWDVILALVIFSKASLKNIPSQTMMITIMGVLCFPRNFAFL